MRLPKLSSIPSSQFSSKRAFKLRGFGNVLAERKPDLLIQVVSSLAAIAAEKIQTRSLADETIAVNCLGQIGTLIQKSAEVLDKNNLGEAFESQLIPLFQTLATNNNSLVIEVIEVALILMRNRKSKPETDHRVWFSNSRFAEVICQHVLLGE